MKPTYRFPTGWLFMGVLMITTFYLFYTIQKPNAQATDHNAFSPSALEAAEKQQRIYLAKQYKERIQSNEHTIKTLANEKEWLENKIKRLEEHGRAVPWQLHHSMELKNQKIEAALNENDRLKSLLQHDKFRFMEERPVDDRLEDLFSPSYHETGKENDIRVQDLFSTPHYGAYTPAASSKKLKQEISDRIKKSELGEWFQFSSDTSTCAIENILPILFASGSATIPKEYKTFLKRLADLVKPYDVRITINGYADPDNIRTKKYPSNFELGATRAANIVHELVKNGVNPAVFQIGTTGKYRMESKGMSDKKLLERRADLKIIFISKERMG